MGALGSKSGHKIILVWGYANQTVKLDLPDGTDLGVVQTNNYSKYCSFLTEKLVRDEQPRIESGRMFILRVVRVGKPRKKLNSSEKNRVIYCKNLGRKIFQERGIC